MPDALTMTVRGLRLTARKPDALITSLMLPVMIMLVFVYLFGGAINVGTRYVTYVVPGVLMLCAIVGGHVIASLVRHIASTGLLFAVAFGIGFRPHATVGHFLAAVGVLVLFVLAISWLCAALGLLVKSPDAANSAMFLMFLAYASSAFTPVRTMSSWLRGFAGYQPITPVTESIRGFLLGQPAGGDLGPAIAWCAGITVVSVAVSAVLFLRRTV